MSLCLRFSLFVVVDPDDVSSISAIALEFPECAAGEGSNTSRPGCQKPAKDPVGTLEICFFKTFF